MPAKCLLRDRFWKWVDRSAGADKCWPWLGATNNKGYGYTGDDCRKKTLSHRVAYTLSVGAIPSGKQLLHSCDNPRCANPSHLFPGTRFDNMRDCAAKGRIWQQKKNRCPKGHQYNEANTYVDKRKHRFCRKCKAAKARRQYRRRLAIIGAHNLAGEIKKRWPEKRMFVAVPQWGEVS